MKCRTARALPIAVALLLAACGDDASNMDPEDTSTGGNGSSTTSTDPSGGPGSSSEPGTTTTDPGTTEPGSETGDPSTTSGEPTSGTTAGDDSTSAGADDTTTWALEVDVDLGGVFDVTADVVIEIDMADFTAAVVTQDIAGQPEMHDIPLTGTVEGTTLTMSDSPFTIDVGGVIEDFLVSGTATIDGDSLTGSGTFTSSFDGGKPIPGSYTITNATLVE